MRSLTVQGACFARALGELIARDLQVAQLSTMFMP